MAEENEKKEFDYKAVASRLNQASPRGGAQDLIKCGDIKLVHKMIEEKNADIDKLHKEVESLNHQFKEQVKDREDVIIDLTRQNDDKMKKQIDLEQQISAWEKKNEKTKTETVKNYQQQNNDVDKLHTEQIKETDVQVSELNENLGKMSEAKKEQTKYQLELNQWQNDCNTLEKVFQEEKYRIEIDQARMKKEMEAENQAKLEEYKYKANQEAQRNIQEIERTIHYENQKLTEKTMSQRYTLDYYKREKEKLRTKETMQRRDINIQLETSEQYEQRGLQQQKQIRILKDKIKVLETSLQQIVYDFEKEKELLKFQHESIIQEQREDITKIRSSIQTKNRELKNVRALAQVMLNQRSEIEQFFLEALEQIKEEIRKKIAIERKQKRQEFGGIIGQPKMPHGISDQGNSDIGNSMMAGSHDNQKLGNNKQYSEKVDLNDLDWEDRERVLRLLFSKMNAGIPTNSSKIQAKQMMQSERGGSAGMNQQDYLAALPALQYEEQY